MNPEPPRFSDDEEPRRPEPKRPRPRTSRAEVLGWFAAVFLFAGVAWLLLFPLMLLEIRALLSAGCLLIGGAFFAFAWRELR